MAVSYEANQCQQQTQRENDSQEEGRKEEEAERSDETLVKRCYAFSFRKVLIKSMTYKEGLYKSMTYVSNLFPFRINDLKKYLTDFQNVVEVDLGSPKEGLRGPTEGGA
jgi:hypothetical protein